MKTIHMARDQRQVISEIIHVPVEYLALSESPIIPGFSLVFVWEQ